MATPILNFSICDSVSSGDHGRLPADIPGAWKWWCTSIAPPGTFSFTGGVWAKILESGKKVTAPVAASALRNVRRSVIRAILPKVKVYTREICDFRTHEAGGDSSSRRSAGEEKATSRIWVCLI